MSTLYEEGRKYLDLEDYDKALEIFTNGDKEGDIECSFTLAQLLLSGDEVEKDENRANEIFARILNELKEQGEQGNISAQYNIGIFYENGYGVEPSYTEAAKWYLSAAEQGDADAQYNLGIIYQEGRGVEESIEEAEKWYRLAASQNFYKAHTALGEIYEDKAMSSTWGLLSKPKGMPKKEFEEIRGSKEKEIKALEEEAQKWYIYPAECGDIKAQERIWYLYKHGTNVVEKNPAKAFKYLCNLKEYRPDWMHYQYELAEMYRYGIGTEKDCKKAAELFENIIQKETNGDKDELKDSQWQLGLLYEDGEGVEKDVIKAIQLYEDSYKNRSPIGAFYLARQLKKGEYIAKDVDKYLKLLKYATDKWVPPAFNVLAEEYYSGEFVEKDYKKAFELWSRASMNLSLRTFSDEVFGESNFRIGQCYHYCQGVEYKIDDEATKEERLKKAKEHYEEALKNGFNCRLAYEMVKRDLGERGSLGKTREYAMDLIKSKKIAFELLTQIESDLKNDFGDCWDKLNKNAQRALVSGLIDYVRILRDGEAVCEYTDFTPVVATLAKALEIELAEFFGRRYIEFLRDIKKIPASCFDPDRCRFVIYKNFLRKKENIVYCDERNNYGFSLGSLYHIIGVESIPLDDISKDNMVSHRQIIDKKGSPYKRVINSNMREYAMLLFRKDAFGTGDFEKAVVNYLIDFAEDVRFIKDIRNPADHGTLVNCGHAEILGDILIKVHKIIKGLIEKISPEYIEESLNQKMKVLENKHL